MLPLREVCSVGGSGPFIADFIIDYMSNLMTCFVASMQRESMHLSTRAMARLTGAQQLFRSHLVCLLLHSVALPHLQFSELLHQLHTPITRPAGRVPSPTALAQA